MYEKHEQKSFDNEFFLKKKSKIEMSTNQSSLGAAFAFARLFHSIIYLQTPKMRASSPGTIRRLCKYAIVSFVFFVFLLFAITK